MKIQFNCYQFLSPQNKQETSLPFVILAAWLRGDFLITEAFYSPRDKIAPVQKISVVGVNFSRPKNGGAIFSQTVIVNKSPVGESFMLGVHGKLPSFAWSDFLTGAKISRDTGPQWCHFINCALNDVTQLILAGPQWCHFINCALNSDYWKHWTFRRPQELLSCAYYIFFYETELLRSIQTLCYIIWYWIIDNL